MTASLAGCEVDLSMNGVAGREGGHVEIRTVADFVKKEGHGGEVGVHYCCVCGSRSHGSGCCDCVGSQDSL